jgi:hypothetical protein
LFRQEVVEARRGDWLDSIMVAAPLSRWLLTALAVAFAIALLLFLVFGHHTRREIVTGERVPSAGPLNVVAPSARFACQAPSERMNSRKTHIHGAGLVSGAISIFRASNVLGHVRGYMSKGMWKMESIREQRMRATREML